MTTADILFVAAALRHILSPAIFADAYALKSQDASGPTLNLSGITGVLLVIAGAVAMLAPSRQ